MYIVQDLYQECKEDLGLELVAGGSGLKNKITTPEAHRPGLSLSGYMKAFNSKRSLVFGKQELDYLKDLTPAVRKKRLGDVLLSSIPFVLVTRRFRPLPEMYEICQTCNIPLIRSKKSTMEVLRKLTMVLNAAFAPKLSMHGTFIEIFGVGAVLQGGSSIGKSETALGLLERGHRLVSDDVIIIKKKSDSFLEGMGDDLTRHHMEIRGIGIINVAKLYGAVCVRESKSIDLVIKLETWDDNVFYDRVGLSDRYYEILGLKVPYYVLPVKPGRDIVLLVETIVLNNRLKQSGYNSAEEFNKKLIDVISGKSNKSKI